MIVIDEKTFKMVQSSENAPFFNLYLPYKVNEGKLNEREEMKLFGYGIPFQKCIEMLIIQRLNEKQESYSIKEYMESYIKEIEEIEKLIKNVESIEEPKENE